MFGFLTSRLKTARIVHRIRRGYPDIKQLPTPIQADHIHLEAALDWLKAAHGATQEKGIAAAFNLQTARWGNAYRETTGYIIPTLFTAAEQQSRADLKSFALKLAEWELSEQQTDGAYGELQSDGTFSKKIFNTGQVVFGLCDAARRTLDPRFEAAARRAADWLVSMQRTDGSWERYTTQGPRTYHASVAWPLLVAYQLTHEERYLQAATKSIDWVLDQQTPNGWFAHTSLSHPNHPWTHLIAYTLRGLFECSQLLPATERVRAEKCLDAVRIASTAILATYKQAKESRFPFLPGTLDPHWQGRERSTCLTGDAQLAILWLRLGKHVGDQALLTAAHQLIDDVKKTQIIDSTSPEIRGGIFGSFPLQGSYVAYNTLNWATKFFLDALLLKQDPDLDLHA